MADIVKSKNLTKVSAAIMLVTAIYKFAVVFFGIPLPELPDGIFEGVVGAGSGAALYGAKKF